MNIKYKIYQRLWTSLDWLYPPKCGGCQKPGQRWCLDCQEQVRLVTSPICPSCGQPQKKETICKNCQSNPPYFHALRSWAVFEGPVRHALHRLKYKRDLGLGETLALPLIDTLRKLSWSVDIVVPIPLSIARLSHRGYNQVALIARPLALGMGLKYSPKTVYRIRDTASQVGLSLDQRRQNVTDAFDAKDPGLSGKNILLIDDIATTGATLNSCAFSLHNHGAKNVFCLTVARAVTNQT